MKYLSMVSSNEYLGANEVHSSLMTERWGVLAFRDVGGEVFDSKEINLKLSRFEMLTILIPVLKVFKLLRATKVKYISADGIISYLVAKIVRSLVGGVAVVMLVHNDYRENNRTRWKWLPRSFFNYLYSRLLQDESVVTTSTAAYNTLSNIEGFRVSSIDNIVDVTGLAAQEKGGEDIWYIGRLVSAKNVSDLIKAVNRMSDVRLSIFGIGEEYENLVSQSSESVFFLGFDPDPFSHVKIGDIFVLPSSIEGRSLAALKAMASGMIALFSDINENKGLSKAPGQFFFNVGDDEDLEVRLNYIKNLSMEEKYRLGIENIQVLKNEMDIAGFRSKYEGLFL